MKTPISPLTRSSAKALALLASVSAAHASTDYGPAQWIGTECDKQNTSGYGKQVYVIHDMEGYYASNLNYLWRCDVRVSAHYGVNGLKDTSSDHAPGAVCQWVRDAYYAWTQRCWNSYAMSTEHEGFASNPAWFTESMYVASASLTKSKANKYGIPKDRNHVIGHNQESVSGWASWCTANLGMDPWCNTHSDPGPYWNWLHYMDLVRGTLSTPSAPSSLVATAVTAHKITLTWKDNSGIESGFKIERSLSATSGFTQVATTAANDINVAIVGLNADTRYYFRVRAYNATGNSPYSNTANARTKDTIPVAPASLTATAVSNDQINLAWTQSSPNEDGFRVYRGPSNTNFHLIATLGVNATSYVNTGLAGNRKYYYRVRAFNTAGNSAPSNIASDTTAPAAPTGLTVTAIAGTTNWNKLNLAWTDNGGGETGFKIERALAAAGPFSQIATNPASDRTYTATGLAATTAYYFRVRAYNANGNSDYSNVAGRTTPNAPPVLAAIGNKTVAAGSPLAFTVTSSDPNAPAPSTAWTGTWEGSAQGAMEIVFRNPMNSATTSSFIDSAATNYAMVSTGAPAGVGGTKALKVGWSFKTGTTNYWVRLTTGGAPGVPNPTIALDQAVRFRFHASKALKVAIGVRETGTTAAYGANGGVTGAIEFVGVTNVISGTPFSQYQYAAAAWHTPNFNIPFFNQAAMTGDGKVDQSGAKGTLEHIVLKGEGGTGAYTVWLDDLSVIIQNYRVFALDAGAPAGATIGRRNGKFAWTPSTGQAGVHNITVRVTDNLGAQDFETIRVTVTSTGNAAPVLTAIGNQTVNEGSALTFTATATDANPGQTLTYSLLAGNPAGSSINSSSGAFSWTPTEAQGPGSYPISVRVTDNGSPVSNDTEVITVAVNEVNAAPALAAIANQTINEGQTLNLTAAATDADLPANTITYSVEGPSGVTINSSSGAISYTANEDDGGDAIDVTVTAKDNGVPAKSVSRSFDIVVNEGNTAPTLVVGAMNDLNPFAQFDELDDEGAGGHNNATMFRVPYFSATTTGFIDSTSFAYITNDFPRDDVNPTYQALYVNCNFKTGTVNPWLRLCTHTSSAWTNTYAYPNPIVDLGQHVRFKIWSDKSIKVALGVRETGTQNPLGFDGGVSGLIEWVGATAPSGVPIPSRTIAASNWTQVDFNLPAETIAAFTGNGILAAGKGVLEELAIVPNGGTGSYTIYLDEFETLTTKSTNNITIDAGDTLQFISTGSDADIPAQELSYSLGAGPANAVVNVGSGLFTWKPAAGQFPSTNVITITATDDGTPNLSGSQNVTVVVRAVNTPPRLAKLQNRVVESGSGATVTFDANAQDDDLPAQTLTFSLTAAPTGATINPSTGVFSWTPPAGISNYLATIRVTDNGAPSLWDEQSVVIEVVPGNTAPTLSLGTARATEPVITFETFTNGTPNEQVMFKKPLNSATTSSFLDTNVTNYTSVTTSFPAGNTSAGAKTLRATWTFKTGTANYWVRLNTFNAAVLPNPAINCSARLKFDVYTTKALKVGLGIRETGTTAENGANGGTTGTVEYVGCNSPIGTTPQPTRTVNASTWTTLEFDLPAEPCQILSGDGVLSSGQQVLEHLVLVGAGGTGAYDVYLDNFQVVTTTALPGTVTMKASSTLQFTASATDPNPGAGIGYGLDADFVEAHPGATLNGTSGAFTWTPGVSEIGASSLTVTATDDPTNGAVPKSDTKTFTVVVNADSLAPQKSADGTFVAGGDSVLLTWDAGDGASYVLQTRSSTGGDWSTVRVVTVAGGTSSIPFTNEGTDSYVRVVEAAGASSAE